MSSNSNSSSSSMQSLARNLLRNKAFVNGKWIEAASKQRYAVTNPSDGAVIGEVPDMSQADTAAAVQSAATAFNSWRKLTPSQRCTALLKWESCILQRKDELAALLTLESGKVIAEAQGEVAYGASFIGWFAEEARRVVGQNLVGPAADKRIVTMKQPQGVCGMITPWNFPVAMVTRKAGAALAAGCTVVLKPAEDTPFSALALCQLAEEAGLPAGLINIVTSSRDNAAAIGNELTGNASVRHISFTGSTPVGKRLMEQSAKTVKRVSMELGGNAPFIVFDSADVQLAVNGLIAGKFRNSGQTCICPNRVLVQESLFKQFADLLVDSVSKLKVGDGFAADTKLGPLINKSAGDKMQRLMQDAVAKGATVLTGGGAVQVGNGAGQFFQPTVITNVPRDAAIASEEIFGPIVALYSFKTESEAISLANDTTSGLAGYFYSGDFAQCWRVAEELSVGMVGMNEPAISSCMSPFGGWNESGVGKESGVACGIEEYLDTKSVVFSVPNA